MVVIGWCVCIVSIPPPQAQLYSQRSPVRYHGIMIYLFFFFQVVHLKQKTANVMQEMENEKQELENEKQRIEIEANSTDYKSTIIKREETEKTRLVQKCSEKVII